MKITHDKVDHLIPKKPLYRELDPDTRKLYDKFIRVDHVKGFNLKLPIFLATQLWTDFILSKILQF